MRRMPNIEISSEELNRMIETPFNSGGESVILEGPTKKTLYKVFIDYTDDTAYDYYGNPTFNSITDMIDNKFEKIKKLYEMQLPSSVQPLSTISVDGRLIGYEMTRDIEDIQFNGCAMSRQELIFVLEQTKKILEFYASKDIIYGDVASRNILINPKTKEVKFCDMDNIQIGEHKIDLMSQEIEHYDYVRGLDESTDTYMHNLLTIQQVDNWGAYERILCAMSNKRYPKGFKLKARPTMKSMVSPETFNGESIVQYIKK